MRAAITLRNLDIVTVVPRSGETATGIGALAIEGVGAAEGVGNVVAGFATAAKTSSFLILPPTPVPFTFARFTPFSAASFLTIGVT